MHKKNRQNPTESIPASTSFYTDDDLKIKSLPRVYDATYDKNSKYSSSEKSSALTMSSIALKLSEFPPPFVLSSESNTKSFQATKCRTLRRRSSPK